MRHDPILHPALPLTRYTTLLTQGCLDLSIVQEDVDVPYLDLPEPDTEEALGAHEVTPPISTTTYEYAVHQSPGAQSAISGTTAISTAQTVHDPADLNRDMMLEYLDDLYTDADKILKIIAPRAASTNDLASVVSEAMNSSSRLSKLLETRANRLKEACQYFSGANSTTEEPVFIERNSVLASFAGMEDRYDVFRRPDAILYKANLAIFTKELATSTREQQRTYELLLRLDHTMPRYFTSSLRGKQAEDFDQGCSALFNETFRLALDIRTQLAIVLLARQPNFDPHASISEVFFPDFEEDGESEALRLRGWDAVGLGGGGDDDLSRPIKDAILERVKDIRGCFRKDEEALEKGDYVDSNKLDFEFPWSGFVKSTLDWARRRNVELEDEINLSGGVSKIQASLKEYLSTGVPQSPGERRQTASQSQRVSAADVESQSQAIPKPEPAVTGVLRKHLQLLSGLTDNVGNHELVNALGEISAVKGVATEADEDYQPPVQDDDEDGNEDEDGSRTFVDLPAQRRAIQDDLKILRQREKQNKENMRKLSADTGSTPRRSFYDRQAGATRVSFDEPGPSPTREVNSPSNSQDGRRSYETGSHDDDQYKTRPSNSQSRGKGRRIATESDEDDLFETRLTNSKRQVPVQKRARYDPPSVPSSSAQGQSQAHRPSNRIVEDSPDESDDDESGPSHAQQLKVVSRQAKARNIAAGSTAGAKGRTPWSDEEVNALLEGVANHSRATRPWKLIKEGDKMGNNILSRRSNTDLKDKAMNIICNYKMSVWPRRTGLLRFTDVRVGLGRICHKGSGISNSLETFRKKWTSAVGFRLSIERIQYFKRAFSNSGI